MGKEKLRCTPFVIVRQSGSRIDISFLMWTFHWSPLQKVFSRSSRNLPCNAPLSHEIVRLNCWDCRKTVLSIIAGHQTRPHLRVTKSVLPLQKFHHNDRAGSRLVELLKVWKHIHALDDSKSYHRGQFDRLSRLFWQVKATYTAIVSIWSGFYVFWYYGYG